MNFYWSLNMNIRVVCNPAISFLQNNALPFKSLDGRIVGLTALIFGGLSAAFYAYSYFSWKEKNITLQKIEDVKSEKNQDICALNHDEKKITNTEIKEEIKQEKKLDFEPFFNARFAKMDGLDQFETDEEKEEFKTFFKEISREENENYDLRKSIDQMIQKMGGNQAKPCQFQTKGDLLVYVGEFDENRTGKGRKSYTSMGGDGGCYEKGIFEHGELVDGEKFGYFDTVQYGQFKDGLIKRGSFGLVTGEFEYDKESSKLFLKRGVKTDFDGTETIILKKSPVLNLKN